MKAKYRIFTSPDGDWFVLAKLIDGAMFVHTLYEGHSRALAYEALLGDLRAEYDIREVPMENGSFRPRPKDFRN